MKQSEVLIEGLDFQKPKRGQSQMPRFFAPYLQIQLSTGIRAGFATHFYEREIVAIQATDSAEIHPRIFFIKEGMPWDVFYEHLLSKWNQGGQIHQIHPSFRLLRPIPPDLMESASSLGPQELHQVMTALRKNKFLNPLQPLQQGTQPHFVAWNTVRDLCLI